MTDKIREKLLPCPFCGGEAEVKFCLNYVGAWVQCKRCKTTSPLRKMTIDDTDVGCKQEVIKIWNTRTNTANAEARELVKMANLHLNNALHELNLDRNDISKLKGGAIVISSINYLRMIGTQINLAQEQLTKWLEEGK